jgi:predicted patatin/cPLA2 family phospholipase
VHPVLALLAERAAAGSRPAERSDGQRAALVIEGGGMRGVVSAAMAATIERHGLLDGFDLVAGTSAGALNAAALLAGVAEESTDEYAQGFANGRFINPARLLLGRPAVDVEYVIDYSSERLPAERHDRTLDSAIELHCVATDVDDAVARDLTAARDLEELRGALLASSRLPWIGGEPVRFRGRRWLDGGLSEPLALPTALAAGATHVLVLLTRPRGGRVEPTGSLTDRLIERRLRALNPALVGAYRRRPRLYAELTDGVVAATDSPGGQPPYVMGISLPAGSSAAELARRCAVDVLRPAVAAR